ncbi:hypothetical protein QT711_11245 [Sporosarcina saromensis]|uniref:Phage major tail protein, phi13 family n=1 Tax=Sporosarcina saromensis TaxID=359365 RepID=A0ABU4G9X8_9BACL|nr:hypothetical protein [Sporosarcina saromensis]MDW0113763.1 hypothetical protein [Sporosarcina saromensis]
MAEAKYIDVPIGPAIVEYGEEGDMTTFDITKGGIVFRSASTKHDVTVDQYGDTVVKSIFKGRTCEVVVPFALSDLAKLATAIPNSELIADNTVPTAPKLRLNVFSQAGYNMTEGAKKLVIKPTDPSATPNDWITVPIAAPLTDPEYTYNSDNERIANMTFAGYPDLSNKGLLYFMGDETATPPVPGP